MVVIELPEAYGYVVLANGIVAFVSNFLLAGCASALSHAVYYRHEVVTGDGDEDTLLQATR